jgi:hypothetical protein
MQPHWWGHVIESLTPGCVLHGMKINCRGVDKNEGKNAVKALHVGYMKQNASTESRITIHFVTTLQGEQYLNVYGNGRCNIIRECNPIGSIENNYMITLSDTMKIFSPSTESDTH